jgi:hypothetical protein
MRVHAHVCARVHVRVLSACVHVRMCMCVCLRECVHGCVQVWDCVCLLVMGRAVQG